MAPQTDDKLTKGFVRYRPHAHSARERCGNCMMYQERGVSAHIGRCSLVEGSIDPEYVCDRWEPKR